MTDPKRINIAYWIVTGLFSTFMVFSSIGNIMVNEESIAFVHDGLGYPVYFIAWIGWAKVLGALAIILPMVPARVKEWAYFGLFIDLATATYSFIATHAPVQGWTFMLLFIAVLVLSYYLYHRRVSTANNA